jgi:hypothetical protein
LTPPPSSYAVIVRCPLSLLEVIVHHPLFPHRLPPTGRAMTSPPPALIESTTAHARASPPPALVASSFACRPCEDNTATCSHFLLRQPPPARRFDQPPQEGRLVVESFRLPLSRRPPPARRASSAAHRPRGDNTTISSCRIAHCPSPARHHRRRLPLSTVRRHRCCLLLSRCPPSTAMQQQRCHLVSSFCPPPAARHPHKVLITLRKRAGWLSVFSTRYFGMRGAAFITAVNRPGKMRASKKMVDGDLISSRQARAIARGVPAVFAMAACARLGSHRLT